MFFTAGVSFATFSLLTRHLNQFDYGIINLYNSTSILLVAFISCGVQFVLNVDYFKLPPEQYRKRFSNSIRRSLNNSAKCETSLTLEQSKGQMRPSCKTI